MSSRASWLSDLGDYVSATTLDAIPLDVRDRSKLIIADTLGAAVLGSGEQEIAGITRQLEQAEGSSLLRVGFPQARPQDAAFVNAAATCANELDEGIRPTGHPSLHTLPAALAMAESLHASGSQLLNAFILGYEAQARLYAASRLRWPVHPHGGIGNIGGVVAVGKLLDWTHSEIVSGVNLAASLATATSWKSCFAGATVRNIYPALSANCAFMVPMLLRAGVTAPNDAVEEAFGVILGDALDHSILEGPWGSHFYMRSSYFKFHAACALVHPTLDAAVAATRQRPPEWPRATWVKSVRSIEVKTFARAARLAVPSNGTKISAKFSIPYAVAACLALGRTDESAYTPAALANPAIRSLASKVSVEVDDDLTGRWPAEAGATIVIRTAGRPLEARCITPYGDPSNPPKTSALREKFTRTTRRALTGDASEAAWRDLQAVELLPNMAGVLREWHEKSARRPRIDIAGFR